MMKRIDILTALVLTTAVTSSAQIANWKVMPEYDGVQVRENGLVEVTLKSKHGLLDSEGSPFLPIAYDSIGAFTDNHALLFNDSKFVAFVDNTGRIVEIDPKFTLVPDMHFFSNGFLPVKKGNHYYYMDTDGKSVAGPFAAVRPYFDGYAAIEGYVDLEKKPKDTFIGYIDREQHLVKFKEYDKKDMVKADDLSFISSFRDGQAMYILKRKAYFLSTSLESTPIATDPQAPKKTIIQFDKNGIPTPIDGGYLIKGKIGYFYFNEFMQLDKIEISGTELYGYNVPKSAPKADDNLMTVFGDPGAMGVMYNGEVVLPEQFAEVIPLGGQFAAVKTDKWGIIRIDTLNKFILKLNNNEHIGFNHRFHTAKLAASMPSYLKCNNATIVSKSDDCEIQIESRHENDNIERNTLTYDCRLSIPPHLTDTLQLHEYTYAIKYNGFTSIDYKVVIPEWYVKYYEVELSNNRFAVAPNDTVNVEFDLIKTDVARNDETNYFKNVELITSEATPVPLNKITENHYGFRIGGIDREKLSFVVRITEVGCPPIEYPFEMVFEKPDPTSKKKDVDVTVTPIRRVATLQLPSTHSSTESTDNTDTPSTVVDTPSQNEPAISEN